MVNVLFTFGKYALHYPCNMYVAIEFRTEFFGSNWLGLWNLTQHFDVSHFSVLPAKPHTSFITVLALKG